MDLGGKKFLQNLWDLVLLKFLCVISGAIIAGTLLYLVITRYVFDFPSSGLHNLALIAALWFYMMGALLASRSREHLAVDILANKVKNNRLKAFQKIVIAILKLIIIMFFAYWTYRMFLWESRFSITMPGSSIPTWVPQIAIAVNAIGSMLYAAIDVISSSRLLKNTWNTNAR